ncbi:MAG: ArsR family transcriptional regulator, arsenate/arsenite/antimonite-responsive transcriptional [Actinomycetota bacterium]|jgi:ArsR family transcriptional regulator|nr:ArsR family transcriptional regulator, arsenate/arsenite/antimonite-responsive transcriptional [Actinomycetota bacterium]
MVMVAQDIDGCQYRAMKKIADIVMECCPPLLGSPVSKDEATALADAFKVLADPARVRLLSLVAAHPGGECCVCDLIEPLGISQPTVSHHLKVLHEGGLLDREKRGTWVYYKVVPSRLEELRTALQPV